MSESQEKRGKKGHDRTRNFAFVVYPDSAPDGWRDILDDFHVEALISPLHDKDVMPDGSPKKAHWHVLVMYSSVKTIAQAQELRDAVGGVGWENVASVRGYARYLIHADNPDKYQYDIEDVIEIGGADYMELTRRSADGPKLVREMTQYIEENDILWYDDFFRYCAENEPEWFEQLVTRSTYVVYTYIKARGKHHEAVMRDIAKGGGYVVNPDTGEVEKGEV